MGVAIGCATRDRTVAFASTFAAFFSRAYDQIRMGAISQSNVNLVGSHCGVSIGKLLKIELIHTENVFSLPTCQPLFFFFFFLNKVRMVRPRWP